jgi:hypothetical protein
LLSTSSHQYISVLDAAAVARGNGAADAGAAGLRLDRDAHRAPYLGLLPNLDGPEHVPRPHVHVELHAHRRGLPFHLLLQLAGDVAGDGHAPPLELQLHYVAGLPLLVELRRRRGAGALADDDRTAAVAEPELGVHGVVVDVDALAGVVEAQADGEVVGDGGGGDGEVGERGGVDGGAYLVWLEDGPVDEDYEAGGEDERAAAAAARIPRAAAGAGHDERRRRRSLIAVASLAGQRAARGKEEPGRSCVCVP